MKKLIVSVVSVVLIMSISFAQDQFLFVNPDGHKGEISDLVVSNDGKYIITGGFDKTIKKWDVETGEMVLQYHGNIGIGVEGSVYNLALSPDNKILAVQGWFGADDESEPLGDVRLFDFETGKMIHVFHELQGSPTGVGFSNDSKFLIAGDNTSKILKWDLTTKKVVGEFKFHSSEYNEELDAICVKNNKMLSLDKLGNLCLWDINKTEKPLIVESKIYKKIVKENGFTLAPQMDINPESGEVVLTWELMIIVYDKNLKFKQTDALDQKFSAANFSQNGKMLITGCSDAGDSINNSLYIKGENGLWDEIAILPSNASVSCAKFINDNLLVIAGGKQNEITFWKLDFEKEDISDIKILKNNGIQFFSVGLNGSSVSFSDEWTENNGFSKFNKEFDLFKKDISNIKNPSLYNKPDTVFGDYSIRRSWVVNSMMNDYNKGLKILYKGIPKDTIIREDWEGARHTAFTFDPKGNIISGGDMGVLRAYNTDGFELNYFIGHTGFISGISISEDKKRLITSSDDNTIKIWSLDKVGQINPAGPKESIWDHSTASMGENNVYHRIFKTLNVEEEAKKKTFEAWENVIWKLERADYPTNYFKKKMYEYKSQNIYPIASIFISTEGEWIIWNEDGYFCTSKKGAQYIGYHLNQGPDKEAKFFPFEQFDLKFNRPDIILKDLSIGSQKIIDFYYKAYQKRLKKMNITESQLSGELHLPEVKIANYTVSPDKKKVTLNIEATDSKYALNRLNIFLDDVPVYGKNGIALTGKTFTKTIDLELTEGKNKIQVSVLNDKGVESLKENLVLFSPKNAEKPNLYLVTIGTSHYKDKRFDLKYAAKDADDIAKLFDKDKMYSNIYHKTLFDQQATKENIKALKEFLLKAGRNDVVMVFVAGHGLLDENFDYYYATYDVDFNNPSLRGMIYSEIEELLDGISALRKLLFMDTCHSGEVDKDDVEEDKSKQVIEEDVTFRNVGVGIRNKEGEGLENTSELVKELFTDLRKGTGATVISSAGGVEYAMESDKWQNGLFTYCLLHGLADNTADLNNDGTVMLSEIQEYIRKEVFKLSNGKQKPTSRMENITLDYPIW